MTNYEKFMSNHVRTTTTITMYGDWTDKLHIVRSVNGYSERALITAKYDATTLQTIITVKGV